MSNIEKLYYNMEKLNDDYKDSKEVTEANEKVIDAIGRDEYMKHESEIVNYASVNEKQGFIIGFQYAVSLLMNGKSDDLDAKV